jgi:hypothetical protein
MQIPVTRFGCIFQETFLTCRQTVKDVYEGLPQLYAVLSLALVVEAVDAVQAGALVVAA